MLICLTRSIRLNHPQTNNRVQRRDDVFSGRTTVVTGIRFAGLADVRRCSANVGSGAQMRHRRVHAVGGQRSGKRGHQIVVQIATFTLLRVLHRSMWLHTRRSPARTQTNDRPNERNETKSVLVNCVR